MTSILRRDPAPVLANFALGDLVLYDAHARWRFSHTSAVVAVVVRLVPPVLQIRPLVGPCRLGLEHAYVRPRELRRLGTTLSVDDLAQGIVDEIRGLAAIGTAPGALGLAVIDAIRRAWDLQPDDHTQQGGSPP